MKERSYSSQPSRLESRRRMTTPVKKSTEQYESHERRILTTNQTESSEFNIFKSNSKSKKISNYGSTLIKSSDKKYSESFLYNFYSSIVIIGKSQINILNLLLKIIIFLMASFILFKIFYESFFSKTTTAVLSPEEDYFILEQL